MSFKYRNVKATYDYDRAHANIKNIKIQYFRNLKLVKLNRNGKPQT
jgi:hypothetical protein